MIVDFSNLGSETLPKLSDPIETHAAFLRNLIYGKSYASIKTAVQPLASWSTKLPDSEAGFYSDDLSSLFEIEIDLDFDSEPKDVSPKSSPILPTLKTTKIVPGYHSTNSGSPGSAEPSSIARTIHGAQHISRVAIWIQCLVEMHRLQGNPEAHAMSEEDIKLLQIAGLLHDSGREDEEEDFWDEDSAHNCYTYLVDILKVDPARALAFVLTIADKDFQKYETVLIEKPSKIKLANEQFELCEGAFEQRPRDFYHTAEVGDDGKLILKRHAYDDRPRSLFTSILHDADCLDIIRARKIFDPSYLDLYSLCCDKEKVVTNREHFELLARFITEIREIILQQGDDPKRFNLERKKEFELADNTYLKILEHIATNPEKYVLLNHLLFLPPCSAKELSQRYDDVRCAVDGEMNRLLLAGELFLRGVTQACLTDSSHFRNQNRRLGSGEAGPVLELLSRAEVELAEMLKPGGNRDRSTVLAGFGASSFSAAGFIVKPQSGDLGSLDGSDICSAYGSKEHLFFKKGTPEEKEAALNKLRDVVKMGGDGIGYEGSNHNECNITITRDVVGIYYTTAVTYFYNHTPEMNVFEALYLQGLCRAHGMDLPVYCYSPSQNTMVKKEFTLEDLYQLLDVLSLKLEAYLSQINKSAETTNELNLSPLSIMLAQATSFYDFISAQLDSGRTFSHDIQHNLQKYFPLYNDMERHFAESPVIVRRRQQLANAIALAVTQRILDSDRRIMSSVLLIVPHSLIGHFGSIIKKLLDIAVINPRYSAKLNEIIRDLGQKTTTPDRVLKSIRELRVSITEDQLSTVAPPLRLGRSFVNFSQSIVARKSGYYPLLEYIHWQKFNNVPLEHYQESCLAAISTAIELVRELGGLLMKVKSNPALEERILRHYHGILLDCLLSLKILLPPRHVHELSERFDIPSLYSRIDNCISTTIAVWLETLVSIRNKGSIESWIERDSLIRGFSLQYKLLVANLPRDPLFQATKERLLIALKIDSTTFDWGNRFEITKHVPPQFPLRREFIDSIDSHVRAVSLVVRDNTSGQLFCINDGYMDQCMDSFTTDEVIRLLQAQIPDAWREGRLFPAVITGMFRILHKDHSREMLAFFEAEIMPQLINNMAQEEPVRSEMISMFDALLLLDYYQGKVTCLPKVVKDLMIQVLKSKPDPSIDETQAQSIIGAYEYQRERLIDRLESFGIYADELLQTPRHHHRVSFFATLERIAAQHLALYSEPVARISCA